MNNAYIYGLIFGFGMMSVLVVCVYLSFMSLDWSGPILSEMNPNGSVDEWFLFDGAYEAYR